MNIVAISGSLRNGSTNTIALQAAALVASRAATVALYEGLGSLPHFNPDLDIEGTTPPAEVVALRECLRAADALLISSPEYAHGVPGSLKNLLDWVVSDGLLVGKRVVLINATPPATFAHAALIETLRTMNWTVVMTIELPLRGKKLDAAAIARDPELASQLRAGILALKG